jgi:hypothetical protein
MALCQGEEIMVDAGTRPFKRIYFMAFYTACRKTCSGVIRIGCGGIVLLVATKTIGANGIKPEVSIGNMALRAISNRVGSLEWK